MLASAELARTRSARRRGLLGRDGIEGAMVLQPARSVHTVGMRFPIDVAWCDEELNVLRMARLPRYRVTRAVLHAHAVIEAEAGSFARWDLHVGDHLELKE